MFEKLAPDYIEHIHDVLVGAFLPFDEKVNPAEYRSRALIESAAARPFQTAFGEELWPSLPQKAAALFHSLACNHCFINGNKRTAVIALDLFLTRNMHILVMNSDDVYAMAKATATANEEGRPIDTVMADIAGTIAASTIDINIFEDPDFIVRLGDRYPKVAMHLARVVALSRRVAKLERTPA